MTIFMKILLEILREKMQEGLINSIQADGSPANIAAASVGYGRDPEIAAAKQKILQNYINLLSDFSLKKRQTSELATLNSEQIEQLGIIDSTNALIIAILSDNFSDEAQLSASIMCDNASYSDGVRLLIQNYLAKNTSDEIKALAMNALIKNCENEIQQLVSESNSTGSNIGSALKICYEYIRDLKDELETDKLLNKPFSDDDAYDQFAWQIGRYGWHTVKQPSALANQKKAAGLSALGSCRNDLNEVNIETGHPIYLKYSPSYSKQVLSHLKSLEEVNKSLCEQNTSIMSIPLISWSIFSTVSLNAKTFVPRLGKFSECISLAVLLVEKIKSAQDERYTQSSSSSSA